MDTNVNKCKISMDKLELYGITVGPDRAMWFTEYKPNKIGTIIEYDIPTANVDFYCEMWFAEECGKVD